MAVAVVLWIMLICGLFSFGRSDPAGNGRAVAYSEFIAIALWVVLGLMFLVAVIAHRASLIVVVGVVPLLGTSLAATMAAIRLIDEEKKRRWVVVPITGPLLLMVVIVGAYFYWNTPVRYGFV